jgi:hypothetical protein
MNIGTRLKFPDGFGAISKNQQLHLLNNSRKTKWTTLVEFIGCKQPRADFHRILRDDFELGLHSKLIRETDKQPTLPQWLEPLEGIDLAGLELERLSRKKSNIERATDRYAPFSLSSLAKMKFLKRTTPLLPSPRWRGNLS